VQPAGAQANKAGSSADAARRVVFMATPCRICDGLLSSRCACCRVPGAASRRRPRGRGHAAHAEPAPVDEGPRLVALIPAHNEEERVGDAIRALREQTLPPDLIVVVAALFKPAPRRRAGR
jgi:hypothetical protein